MIKIAITGPESCGKTSLADALAQHYHLVYVPEFARNYLHSLERNYSFADLDIIAKGQWNAIDEAEKNTNHLLISDTEMLVMNIWSEVKFGKVSSYIRNALEMQKFDHYIICDTDIPWEPDSLRENENDRDVLLKLYLDNAKRLNYSFTLLSGNHQTRFTKAVEIVDQLLSAKNCKGS